LSEEKPTEKNAKRSYSKPALAQLANKASKNNILKRV
jgi:hypothetical protein